jgi:hypothetical protein
MLNWAKASGFAAMLAVALAGSLHFALYYPPPSYLPSSGGKQTTSEQPKQGGAAEPRGTDQSPIVVKVLPPKPGSDEDIERRREQDQKSATDRGLLWFTAVLAISTLVLMAVTAGLVFFAREQIKDARVVQRAYVRMSHTPPGLRIDEKVVHVEMGIKNFGQTPAMVTDVLLKLKDFPTGTPLPDQPDYSVPRKEKAERGFLVAGDEFFIRQPFDISDSLRQELEKWQGLASRVSSPQEIGVRPKPTVNVYLYGYVDYIDKFGDRQRAGYARFYHPFDDNNLIFTGRDRYNYDRTRRRGEGDDWDE